jgi:hypothetical protein
MTASVQGRVAAGATAPRLVVSFGEIVRTNRRARLGAAAPAEIRNKPRSGGLGMYRTPTCLHKQHLHL